MSSFLRKSFKQVFFTIWKNPIIGYICYIIFDILVFLYISFKCCIFYFERTTIPRNPVNIVAELGEKLSCSFERYYREIVLNHFND